VKGLNVGVIGLNNTFLQLDGSDFKGKLALGIQQFHAVCGDVEDWMDTVDISILLSHHDPDWLNKASLNTFNSEIAPPGMFNSHFCGHLHQPYTKIESIGGSKNKSLRVGASLFGMEKVGANVDRIHGYSSGIMELNESIGLERIWPRIVSKKYAGHFSLGPDPGYDLNEDNSITINFEAKKNSEREPDYESKKDEPFGFGSEERLLSFGASESTNTSKVLDGITKLRIKNLPHHATVRKSEQAQFEVQFRETRIVWVFADWGLGFEGFLSAASSKLGFTNDNVSIFNLVCEEAKSVEDIYLLFQKQFNCSLESFCKAVNDSNKETILILDKISPELSKVNHNSQKFKDVFLKLIIDYCPLVRVVITTRHIVEGVDKQINLKPLDIAQVRSYIKDHPESSSELLEFSTLENLHRYSEGLPMHLDRLLENLKYASLNEIFQEQSELNYPEIELPEPVPKALQESVAMIGSKEDDVSKRSFTLLKLLSVLENGQSLESIKRYDPAKPFYTQNASQLASLSLLDSISYTDIAPGFKKKDAISEANEVIKILKVPKQVRDLVKSLINEEEFDDILKKSAECLFGPKWRDGKIKISAQSPLSTKQIRQGISNELTLTKLLLKSALKRNNSLEVTRAANLALDYNGKLFKMKNFHDCRIGTEEIYFLLKDKGYPDEFLKAGILYAESLRMDSNINRNLAINQFEYIINLPSNGLSNEQKATIFLELSLAYEHSNVTDKAIQNAEEVKKLLKPTSAHYLQAESILINFKYKGEQLFSRLKALEHKARSKKYYTLANNIAYDLATTHSENESFSIRQLNKIIKTKSDVYNIINSIIKKASIYLSTGQLEKITTEDTHHLSFCYSYSYFQRRTHSLTQCHRVIWEILYKENRIADLLQLFRHSSFIWRITDKTHAETEYLEKLKSIDFSSIEKFGLPSDLINLEYFRRRESDI
jgi:hypothetical protein